jgi:hypothetical protein
MAATGSEAAAGTRFSHLIGIIKVTAAARTKALDRPKVQEIL